MLRLQKKKLETFEVNDKRMALCRGKGGTSYTYMLDSEGKVRSRTSLSPRGKGQPEARENGTIPLSAKAFRPPTGKRKKKRRPFPPPQKKKKEKKKV